MTYGLGILSPHGLVLASNSRSSAGVDQIAKVCKLARFEVPQSRLIAILSAGNLATTQAVVTRLRQAAAAGEAGHDLHLAPDMFEVAQMLGAALRRVVDRDAQYVAPYSDVGASFLVGGQIVGRAAAPLPGLPRRQLHRGPAGAAASSRSARPSTGKPNLDRALAWTSTLDRATRLALLSFDATLRSNLSVGLPIDILRYRAGSFSGADFATLSDDSPSSRRLRDGYGEGLIALVDALPSPPERWSRGRG